MARAAPLVAHDLRVLQHLQMLRDCGAAHGQSRGEVADSLRLLPEHLEECAPRRVGKHRESSRPSAPNTRPPAELVANPAAAKAGLKLLYLSCGNKDGLINISQSVHVYLKERGVPHIWNVDDEGHTPKTWASNLYHFGQRLFR